MNMCCQNKAHLRLVLPIQRIDNVSVQVSIQALRPNSFGIFCVWGVNVVPIVLKYQFIYVISDFD